MNGSADAANRPIREADIAESDEYVRFVPILLQKSVPTRLIGKNGQ
jgi:hypothetical protein